MTKTLTEKWKDGTLPYTNYYVKHTLGWKPFGIMVDFWHGPFDKWGHLPEEYVKEVLAPVPSYEEFVQQRDFVKDHLKVLIENMNLKRKLEIATKALKYYDGLENIIVDWKLLTGQEAGTAKNALKKIEEVK